MHLRSFNLTSHPVLLFQDLILKLQPLWQYIFSGVEHPRFQKLYNELTTEEQRQRVGIVLATLA
jgi:hypothetical protein